MPLLAAVLSLCWGIVMGFQFAAVPLSHPTSLVDRRLLQDHFPQVSPLARLLCHLHQDKY